MPAPQPPAFDPRDVPESNATGYPEPHRAVNLHRYNRRLGDHAGLQNYGVVMTRIVPGGQSSHRHAHTRQDEFIYVLEGEVTLESNTGQQILQAGKGGVFPGGWGGGPLFVNHSSADPVRLVVGDRPANDEVSSPNIALPLHPPPEATRRFTRKDGTPY